MSTNNSQFELNSDRIGIPPTLPPPPATRVRNRSGSMSGSNTESTLNPNEISKSHGSVPMNVLPLTMSSSLSKKSSEEKFTDAKIVANPLQEWTPFDDDAVQQTHSSNVFPTEDDDDQESGDDDVLGLLSSENVVSSFQQITDGADQIVNDFYSDKSSSSFSSSNSSEEDDDEEEEPSVKYLPIDESQQPSGDLSFTNANDSNTDDGNDSDNKVNNSTVTLWTITPEQWQYYSKLFNQLLSTLPRSSTSSSSSKNHVISSSTDALPLNASVILQFFQKSQLSIDDLKQIWFLADIDLDEQLTLHEFNIAMHLTVLRKQGHKLPNRLPSSITKIPQLYQQSSGDEDNEDNDEDSANTSSCDAEPLKGNSSSSDYESRENYTKSNNTSGYTVLLNPNSEGDDDSPMIKTTRPINVQTNQIYGNNSVSHPSSVPPLIPPRPGKKPPLPGPLPPVIKSSPPISYKDLSKTSPIRSSIRQSNSDNHVTSLNSFVGGGGVGIHSLSDHSSFDREAPSLSSLDHPWSNAERRQERRNLLSQIRCLRQRNHVLLRLNNELAHEFHEIQGQSQNLEIRLKHLQSHLKQDV